nr:MAG TPA: hypothetical protein [Caudoviricetes sp.]
MKKVIEKKLTISPNNRDVDRLYQEFYSKDKGIAEFKFTLDELTATKVICLFYFKCTKRYQEVEAAIEDNSFTVQFDTSLITAYEPVIGYIYFEKVEQSADVYSFMFNVHVSEIDKAVKTPLIERESGRIVNVKDVVTKQELDELFAKIKEQGGTYDDSNLRTEISHISANIEALKTKTDKDTVYDDSALKQRISALESKPEIDTSQYATKEELSGKANQSEIAHILDDIEVLKAKPDNNTIYDDKPLRDRIEVLENKPSVDTSNLVTRSELDSKGYLTQHQSLDGYVKRSELPEPYNDTELKERVGRLENKPSIDTSKFVTDETLASKGYLTQHQSLEGYAKKSEIPQPYNDTEIKQRLSTIEQKGESYATKEQLASIPKTPQKLTLSGNTLILSDGGGNVTLPTSSGTGSQVNQYEIHGTGMPNGKVVAPVGTTYVDTAVTNGALKWIKRSGAGNQGWEVLTGDTGWRTLNIKSKLGNSFLKVRRKNDLVTYQFGGLSWGWFGVVRRGGVGYEAQGSDKERNCYILGLSGVPLGFRSESSLIGSIYNDKGTPYGTWYLGGYGDSNMLRFQFTDPVPTDRDIGDIRVSSISYLTSEPWPGVLP